MPIIANDLQQGDLIAEFTKFPASCIARGIVGPAWEHKKNVTAQMPLSLKKNVYFLNKSGYISQQPPPEAVA
jgi:hypothetical protein